MLQANNGHLHDLYRRHVSSGGGAEPTDGWEQPSGLSTRPRPCEEEEEDLHTEVARLRREVHEAEARARELQEGVERRRAQDEEALRGLLAQAEARADEAEARAAGAAEAERAAEQRSAAAMDRLSGLSQYLGLIRRQQQQQQQQQQETRSAAGEESGGGWAEVQARASALVSELRGGGQGDAISELLLEQASGSEQGQDLGAVVRMQVVVSALEAAVRHHQSEARERADALLARVQALERELQELLSQQGPPVRRRLSSCSGLQEQLQIAAQAAAASSSAHRTPPSLPRPPTGGGERSSLRAKVRGRSVSCAPPSDTLPAPETGGHERGSRRCRHRVGPRL